MPSPARWANECIEPEPITIQVGPRAYLWRTASYKLRGRGAHAPEKELGADGHLPD